MAQTTMRKRRIRLERNGTRMLYIIKLFARHPKYAAGPSLQAKLKCLREKGCVSLLSDILTDFFWDLIALGVEPSSDRRIVGTSSALSAALAITTGWLLLTFPNPIKQPNWGLGLLGASMMFGSGGVLVSLLHFRRTESDRLFAAVCLTVNVAAVAIPMLWMIFR